MLYRWIFLQLLLLYIKLYSSKIYLKTLEDIKHRNTNIDGSKSDETQSIFVLFPHSVRSKSLSIENLEPSKSLIVRETNPIEDDISINNLNLSQRQKDMLRKRWQSSCDRKAAKVCVKACKSTVKIVCASYKCKKSMKRSFRKECKRNCKARFESSKDTDSE